MQAQPAQGLGTKRRKRRKRGGAAEVSAIEGDRLAKTVRAAPQRETSAVLVETVYRTTYSLETLSTVDISV
jgi:hypothetical protein